MDDSTCVCFSCHWSSIGQPEAVLPPNLFPEWDSHREPCMVVGWLDPPYRSSLEFSTTKMLLFSDALKEGWGFRCMDGGRTSPAYVFWNASSAASPASFPRACDWSLHSADEQQHGCSGTHQQAGRWSLFISVSWQGRSTSGQFAMPSSCLPGTFQVEGMLLADQSRQ